MILLASFAIIVSLYWIITSKPYVNNISERIIFLATLFSLVLFDYPINYFFFFFGFIEIRYNKFLKNQGLLIIDNLRRNSINTAIDLFVFFLLFILTDYLYRWILFAIYILLYEFIFEKIK